MPKITYTLNSPPSVRLVSLIFEHYQEAFLTPGTNEGSITMPIALKLNVDILVENAQGVEWSLDVEVDGNPIKEPSIEGRIISSGTSVRDLEFNW